ncbi:MAG: 1-acyl-sn-glycerol-3-phosphate acyltransferase, partial [Bacteroidota bacterium]
MNRKSKIYPQVIEEIEDWPIYKLHADRASLVKDLNEYTFKELLKTHGDDLDNLIARTIYLEQIRIKENPWKVDPANDKVFWKKLKKQFRSADADPRKQQEILKIIINKYSEEIIGNFKKKTLRFARKFLFSFFNRLLNTAAGRNHHRIWGTKYRLYERLKVYGEVERIRKLMTKGTVVVVPTHFSNLDSILIGYALDAIIGLPSFSYGAGLNLFDSEIAAFYMNRIGTYRVDRRKKNAIYLETLKNLPNLAVQKKTNSLFFPGGTRSRSGALEKKLKVGFIKSMIMAQRDIAKNGDNNKVFIVPLVLSYHVVLEAGPLINQHLKREGEEKYMVLPQESLTLRKALSFAWNFFSLASDITLSFGEPMDVMGFEVDDEGRSIDERGREIDIGEYFKFGNEVNSDSQREYVYSKLLAEKIIESYFRNNVVLSSQLVAFAAFNIIKKKYANLDVFGIIRLPTDDVVISRAEFIEVIHDLKIVLKKRVDANQIKINAILLEDAEIILKDGIKNLGIYHAKKPLKFNEDGNIISEDFKFLYYYHNRLDNYGLEHEVV